MRMTNMEWLASRRRTTARLLMGTAAGAVLFLGIGGFESQSPQNSSFGSVSSSTSGGGGGGDAFGTFQSKITSQTASGPSWSVKNLFKGSRKADPAPPPTQQFDVSPPAPTDQMIARAAPSAPPPPMVSMRPQGGIAGSVNVDRTANAMERSTGQVAVASQPVSTFAVDVDTASYSNVRRLILAGQTPPADAVRPEEMVNYFRYDLPQPTGRTPFSITTDVFRSPWDQQKTLLRVALNGRQVATSQRPNANLVLLIDVSGSMEGDAKLGMLKRAFGDMVDHLKPGDRVSIVTYADSASVALRPTSDHRAIKRALDALSTGGGTNGGDGLRLAYEQARAGRVPGGINRVMIASDGDFNVGSVGPEELKALVERERQGGTTLSTLGVGMSDYNDDVMQTLADAGNGNAAYFDDDLEARKVLRDELQSSIQVIAKDVKAQVEFNPAVVSSYKLIGYENRRLAERSFDDDGVDAGEIGSGHQVTAIYEITPVAGAAFTNDVVARRRYQANRVRSEGFPRQPDVGYLAPAEDGEALSIKLRYKEPNGNSSQLISRTVPASAFTAPPQPTGDAAFAIAVAGFAQRLSGGGPQVDQIIGVAGTQTDQLRQEFIDLVRRSATLPPVYSPPVVQTTVAPPPVQYVPPVQYQPPVQRPTFTENARGLGWTLALLSGILALALAWLDALIRRERVALEHFTAPALASGTADRPDTDALQKAVHAALQVSALETRTALGGFDAAARHSVSAEVDQDLAEEVRVIVERHAPEYISRYVAARRLADADGVRQIEEDLRRTLGVMETRLRGLVQQQGVRDAERLGTGGAFVRERHGAPEDALA